jgi:hypothetical protein
MKRSWLIMDNLDRICIRTKSKQTKKKCTTMLTVALRMRGVSLLKVHLQLSKSQTKPGLLKECNRWEQASSKQAINMG